MGYNHEIDFVSIPPNIQDSVYYVDYILHNSLNVMLSWSRILDLDDN